MEGVLLKTSVWAVLVNGRYNSASRNSCIFQQINDPPKQAALADAPHPSDHFNDRFA